MTRAMAKLALLAAAAAALAPAAPSAAQESGRRVTRIVIYGNDPCPVSESEIIVCARRPDNERYRLPEAFRGPSPADPASQSWADRAETLEYVGRTGPQSCSPVGPGGFTGCWNQLMRSARGERANANSNPR